MRVVWVIGVWLVVLSIAVLAAAPPPPPQRFAVERASRYAAYQVQPRLAYDWRTEGIPEVIVPEIELHVQADVIGIATTQDVPIPPLAARRGADQHARVAAHLARLRRHPWFDGRDDLRIVTHPGARYRDTIRALELADHAGFSAYRYVPPSAALTAPPRSWLRF